MLGVSVPLAAAEMAKRIILERGLLPKEGRPVREGGRLVFPLARRHAGLARLEGARYVEREFPALSRKLTYQEALRGKVPEELLGLLPASYDLVGDLCILGLPEPLEPYGRAIGDAILATHPSVRTVLRRAGNHEGEFRTQALSLLAGPDTRETVCTENGVRIRLDVEQVYFSARLSTERRRICDLVQPGERVLVLFSGAGVYPLAIAKNTAASEILGIEKNPVAHRYAEENLRLNRVRNVRLVLGDARVEAPRLPGTFDRIVMPLPKSAEDFLPSALTKAHAGTMVHLYGFEREGEEEKGAEKARAGCAAAGRICSILRVVKCGQYAPGKFRICVDFSVG